MQSWKIYYVVLMYVHLHLMRASAALSVFTFMVEIENRFDELCFDDEKKSKQSLFFLLFVGKPMER